MKKHLRTVKTSIVLGLLLISLFAASVPTCSAGVLLKMSHYVDITWSGNETGKPVIPRGELRQLDIQIRYGVTVGWFAAQSIFNLLYKGRQVNIKLEIIDTPSWTTATLKAGTVTTQIADQEAELSTILSIRIDDDAPAFGAGYVRIKASVPKMGAVDGYEQEFALEFTPAFLPLINAELTEGNSKQMGPLDTAVFPIVIENMGNARTRVFLEVETIPDGWIAVVTDDVTIAEEKGSKATAYLTIKPPKNFGYHYEEESIRVSMLPTRAENIQEQGEKTYVTVIVESRGFSTPGFELVLLAGALLTVVILMKRLKKK